MPLDNPTSYDLSMRGIHSRARQCGNQLAVVPVQQLRLVVPGFDEAQDSGLGNEGVIENMFGEEPVPEGWNVGKDCTRSEL